MEILSVRYGDPQENTVIINDTYHTPWPGQTRHAAAVQIWVDEGNTIDAYVQPVEPAVDNGDVYDRFMDRNTVVDAFLKGINDGSIEPGANATAANLKQAIVDKM